jgi:hypothetical protein
VPKAAAKKAKSKPVPAKAAEPKATARPAPSRLGDDLPMPGTAPKLSREPVTLIVGRTDIAAGKVRIKRMAPTVVRVAKGQVVHVKHAYRLQEHSEDREEYRFLLKSSLGGVAKPPALARLGDQWGVPEDIGGYLQQEYVCSAPGRHTLEFEVAAEYCVMGWKDTQVKELDREDLKGAIEIVVG